MVEKLNDLKVELQLTLTELEHENNVKNLPLETRKKLALEMLHIDLTIKHLELSIESYNKYNELVEEK